MRASKFEAFRRPRLTSQEPDADETVGPAADATDLEGRFETPARARPWPSAGPTYRPGPEAAAASSWPAPGAPLTPEPETIVTKRPMPGARPAPQPETIITRRPLRQPAAGPRRSPDRDRPEPTVTHALPRNGSASAGRTPDRPGWAAAPAGGHAAGAGRERAGGDGTTGSVAPAASPRPVSPPGGGPGGRPSAPGLPRPGERHQAARSGETVASASGREWGRATGRDVAGEEPRAGDPGLQFGRGMAGSPPEVSERGAPAGRRGYGGAVGPWATEAAASQGQEERRWRVAPAGEAQEPRSRPPGRQLPGAEAGTEFGPGRAFAVASWPDRSDRGRDPWPAPSDGSPPDDGTAPWGARFQPDGPASRGAGEGERRPRREPRGAGLDERSRPDGSRLGLSERAGEHARRPSAPASVDPPPMPRPTPLLRLSARPSPASVPLVRPGGGRSLGEAITAVPPPPPVLEPGRSPTATSRGRDGVVVRLIRAPDLRPVLELIEADRLPGRPACDLQSLRRALNGDFPGDPRGWSGFGEVRTVVAVEEDRVVGVASYATKVTDGTGWLLWLHAGEERAVVNALLDHVLEELGDSTRRRAFSVATSLSFGVEALPVRGRPSTHAALRARGFERYASWRYLVARLDRRALLARDSPLATVESIAGSGEHPAWRLSVETARAPAAVLEVELGPERCGLMHGFQVEPAYRGRGIGRSLLREGMDFLRSQGAATVAAFVETSSPSGPESEEMLDLLLEAGFEDLDELWSYEAPAAGERRSQLIRLPTRFR